VCSFSQRVCAAFLPFGVQHVLAKAIEVPGLPGLALPALDVHYDFVRCPVFVFFGLAGGRGEQPLRHAPCLWPTSHSSARVVVPSCMLTSVYLPSSRSPAPRPLSTWRLQIGVFHVRGGADRSSPTQLHYYPKTCQTLKVCCLSAGCFALAVHSPWLGVEPCPPAVLL
jgi:hypothetical protein